MNTANSYTTDVVTWARQQAAALRAGHFDQLDIEHLAEEIEEVGKSEQRELASRMAVLLAHLLKWQFQSDKRSKSWENTIAAQRVALSVRLKRSPGLKPILSDALWLEEVWADAVASATQETGLNTFPAQPLWPVADVLTPDWLPA